MQLKPPEWTSDAIIYQIFPDSFFNGEPYNDPPETLNWGASPERNRFYGGDLRGIIHKLDYLQKLGVNCIYLTPIFDAPSNHKYDTRNYFKVDEALGGDEALIELVEQVHVRGMRILLDGVFNHCGVEHPFFVDATNRGKESRYWKWFHIDSIPVVESPEPNYRCFAGYGKMPEFDLSNPQVREYLLGVVRYWFEKADIDGWRLDTVEYLHPDFVRAVRETSKEMKPEAYVLGELLHLGTSWFKGGYLDGAMNYRLRKYLLSFFVFNNIDAKTFGEKLYVLRRSYPDWANYAMYNMIDSHDRPRITTLCNGRKEIVRLILLFLFAYPGVPAIYYGDEIGIEGGNDPDCRRSMIWDERLWDRELLEFCKRLIELRKTSPALRKGAFIPGVAENGVFTFEREYGNERVVVCLNNSPVAGEYEIGRPYDVLLSGSARIDSFTLSLDPYGFAVLRKTAENV